MARLKVLFVTAWYPTRNQPVDGIFVREHAKAVNLYDDVVVLHLAGYDQSIKGLWKLEKESDETITEGILIYQVWRKRSRIPGVSYFIYMLSALLAFRRLMDQGFRPDIIHAHIFHAGVPSVLLGGIYRIPVVVSEQSTEFPRRILKGVNVWKVRFGFRRATLVTPVSNALQKTIQDYNIHARFQVVPNVVDSELFHMRSLSPPNNELKRMLVVGLLDSSHKKGLPQLLYALKELQRKRNDWHLDVIGDGPARKEYELLARGLELTNKVTFHGLKSKPEVADWMRQADLLVIPSLFETFSCVAAEALMTGIPVLTTRCGGPEEFVNEEVGYLVPPGDIDALSFGLDYMLDNLGRYSHQEISKYAKDRFSLERVGEKLDEIYRSLKI